MSESSHWELLHLPKTLLPSVFIWGEFGISSFPWHIPVSSLRCLDPRSCPGSSDTGDEFGGCSPYPPLVPTPGSPCLPLPSSSAAWDVPGLGRAHKGGFEGRELGSSKFPSPWWVSLHIPPTPVTGTRTGWVPTGRGAGAEGTEGRDPQAGPSNPIETSFLSPFPTDLVTPCGSGDPLCAHLPLGGVTPSSFPSQGEEAQPGQQLPSPAHLTRGHSSVA